MEQTLDLDALMKAAAQAARRNDAGEAAALLRRALAAQEQALGPDDAALAPNLNNLAMMLERLGDNAEAERCYRRAYAIARRAVGPHDQMTAAARANLVEFLHAIGRLDPLRDDLDDELEPQPPPAPSADDGVTLRLGLDSFESETPAQKASPPPRRPAAPPAGPAEPLEMNLAATPAPAVSRPAARVAGAHAASASARGSALLLYMILGATAIGAIAWVLSERRASVAPTEVASQPAAVSPATPPAPPDSRPAPVDAPATAPSPPAAVPAPPPRPATERAPANRPASAPAAASGLTVEGSLCARLNRGAAWRCDPLPANGDADAVYYYTRVKTPRDAVIRHRWTYQGKPVQTVTLRVGANAREGFRTFSHQRVAGRPGQWEVAFLSADGTVVEARQFTVK